MGDADEGNDFDEDTPVSSESPLAGLERRQRSTNRKLNGVSDEIVKLKIHTANIDGKLDGLTKSIDTLVTVVQSQQRVTETHDITTIEHHAKVREIKAEESKAIAVIKEETRGKKILKLLGILGGLVTAIAASGSC